MIMDCIFCKIARKESPADIVYEDDDTIVFNNIRPSAPIHLLVIPKKHIDSIDDIEVGDEELIGKTIITARNVARDKGLNESGYKLAVNVGKGGGQEVFHLHFHLLGGWKSDKERDIPGMP